MDLFTNDVDRTKNLLPHDGIVLYYGKIFNQQQSDYFFDQLMKTIAWEQDEAILFGKKILTKRKVAWYGDQRFEYTYSNVTKFALPWTVDLLDIKNVIEKETNETYNSCLLNLYHTGAEGMAWHSDGEKDLKKNGAIASVTFGAARSFAFKHKQSKEKISLTLEHGSVLEMKGITQSHWLHRLPPTKKVNTPRINLTFRTMVSGWHQNNNKVL
jgi:alkylated DNA repair dioxygenase AlkB